MFPPPNIFEHFLLIFSSKPRLSMVAFKQRCFQGLPFFLQSPMSTPLETQICKCLLIDIIKLEYVRPISKKKVLSTMTMLYEGLGLQYTSLFRLKQFALDYSQIPQYLYDTFNKGEGLCADFGLQKLAYTFTMSSSIASHVRNKK